MRLQQGLHELKSQIGDIQDKSSGNISEHSQNLEGTLHELPRSQQSTSQPNNDYDSPLYMLCKDEVGRSKRPPTKPQQSLNGINEVTLL